MGCSALVDTLGPNGSRPAGGPLPKSSRTPIVFRTRRRVGPRHVHEARARRARGIEPLVRRAVAEPRGEAAVQVRDAPVVRQIAHSLAAANRDRGINRGQLLVGQAVTHVEQYQRTALGDDHAPDICRRRPPRHDSPTSEWAPASRGASSACTRRVRCPPAFSAPRRRLCAHASRGP